MKLMLTALPLFSLVLWAQSAGPQVKVVVRVDDKPEQIFSDTDLAKMPRHHVSAAEHGTKVEYDGVLLHDVLEKAGAPIGKDLKGKALSTYVLATARDGYAVVYTLTETDSAFTDSEILVADRAQGQPLSDAQGPLRIVVPSDKKPARSLRMLERIDVVQLRK